MSEANEPVESEQKKVASEMASLGGKASAAKLTAEERRERARKAAAERWHSDLPKASHGDPDHPLRIAGLEIGCFVLKDGRRVISQRGLQTGIGMNVSGGAQRLLKLMGSLGDKGIDCKDLTSRINNPIKFVTTFGSIAHGYEATTLADICDVILAARKAGVLNRQQNRIGDQCEILKGGFARVGIIALVDEATGYQYDRNRDDLRLILEKYVSKELARWERTFEADFYIHLHRLKGWKYNEKRRSHAVAKVTVDLTYDRIHPDLLQELKQTRSEKGKLNSKLHQWLTTGPVGGHPRLKQHLEGITALMKVATSWDQYQWWIDQHYPKLNQTALIPFPEMDEEFESAKAAARKK